MSEFLPGLANFLAAGVDVITTIVELRFSNSIGTPVSAYYAVEISQGLCGCTTKRMMQTNAVRKVDIKKHRRLDASDAKQTLDAAFARYRLGAQAFDVHCRHGQTDVYLLDDGFRALPNANVISKALASVKLAPAVGPVNWYHERLRRPPLDEDEQPLDLVIPYLREPFFATLPETPVRAG